MVTVKTSGSIDDRIFFVALFQQAVALLLGALTLDGGATFRLVLCAVFVYSSGLFLIFARRFRRLTRADQIFSKWGFVALVIIFGFLNALRSDVRL